MKKYKVFFTDDHAALRDALAAMVNGLDHFESVGVASDGAEAIAAFENGLEADIIVLDLNMPVKDGYAVAEWLTLHRPDVKILILTMGVTNHKLEFLMGLGVNGIINKDVSRPELIAALESVAAGNIHYSNTITRDMAEYFRNQRDKKDARKQTEQETAYIKYCAMALTDKEIADRMGLSKHATEQLRVNLFAGLTTKSRVALAVYGLQNGIISFDELNVVS